MADLSPGQPYTPTFAITDANGAAVTSGVTGTVSLYGPGSSTVALGSGALTHRGNGVWGFTFAGSLLTSYGTYTYTVPTLTTPSAVLTNQGGTFTVGQAGNLWTFRQLYVSIRRGLRDGFTGTTTGTGTTTTAIVSGFAWGSTNSWIGSELLFLAPANTVDLNPVRVTAFDPAAGTFTFAGQPVALATTASGQEVMVVNRENRGWSHAEVVDAIVTAVRRARSPRTTLDEVSLTWNTSTREYAVPAQFVHVDRVEYQIPSALTGEWQLIADRYWEWEPNHQRIYFQRTGGNSAVSRGGYGYRRVYGAGFSIPNGAKLRLTGEALPVVPTGALGELLHADGPSVRDDVLYELLMMSENDKDRQRAATLGGGVMRSRGQAAVARL